MERTLDLSYDELVIGADLSALCYSYAKKIPLLHTRKLKPYKYGYFDDYEKRFNQWNHYMFILSLNGFVPFSDSIQIIRLEENNLLKVTTKDNYLINIKFNNLVISDDHKFEGLPQPVGKTNNYFCVIDHMGIREEKKFPEFTQLDINVPNKIYKPNKYIYMSKNRKKFIVTSLMTEEELKSLEFSEPYVVMRLRRLYGSQVGELKHLSRESHDLGKNIYNLPNNIKLLTEEPDSILSGEIKDHKYTSYIEKKLWTTRYSQM